MNLAYRDIWRDPDPRRDLRAMGIETTTIYTAFMAVPASQLTNGGEMVSRFYKDGARGGQTFFVLFVGQGLGRHCVLCQHQ